MAVLLLSARGRGPHRQEAAGVCMDHVLIVVALLGFVAFLWFLARSPR